MTKSNNTSKSTVRSNRRVALRSPAAVLALTGLEGLVPTSAGPQGPEVQPEPAPAPVVDLPAEIAPELPPVEPVVEAPVMVEGPEGPPVDSAPETLPTGSEPVAAPTAEASPAKPAKVQRAPRAPKTPKVRQDYPFETKGAIATRLNSDDGYVVHALCTLAGLQTDDEQEQRVTRWKNRVGFMASQAKRGTELAIKSRTEGGLSEEDRKEARALCLRYTRQLALFSRQQVLAANPDDERLQKLAKLFSAGLNRTKPEVKSPGSPKG